MNRYVIGFALVGVAAMAAFAMAGPARAQQQGASSQAGRNTQETPKGFNYVIRDGKPVPKSQRVTNADGSWREEPRSAAASPSRKARPTAR